MAVIYQFRRRDAAEQVDPRNTSAEVIPFPKLDPIWVRRAVAAGECFTLFETKSAALRCIARQPRAAYRLCRLKRGSWVLGVVHSREVIGII